MVFSISSDTFGRLVCTIDADGCEALVTASDTPAATLELLAAIQDAEEDGYGECLWHEATGAYRWMLRRMDAKLTLVVLWSSGTVTGWQHVVHTETDFGAFASAARLELAQAGGTAGPR